MKKHFSKFYDYFEWFLVLVLPLVPLLFTLPYRINLFLAWEGAYRISQGEIPYKDFGSPVGYVFWLLPALFFKIFGPYVATLLKVQAFTNILSNLLLVRILKQFGIKLHGRIIVLTVFILSYVLFNFWPWYNHLVFVVELASIYFLLRYLLQNKKVLNVVFSAILVVLAFLTKQDTGGLTLVLTGSLLIYDSLLKRNIKSIIFYCAGLIIAIVVFILPFTFYDFGYWFNYGQYPHFSRLTIADLLDEFLGASKWLKFYLLITAGLILYQFNSKEAFLKHKESFTSHFIVLFILFQASVIQITSYTPLDGNIYFHTFFVALLILNFQDKLNFKKGFVLWPLLILVGFWWSNVYWVRFARSKVLSKLKTEQQDDVISKNTYLLSGDSSSQKMNRGKWIVPEHLPTFKGVKIPEKTAEGIMKLTKMDVFKRDDIRVLNMTELTPLAYELDLAYDQGENIPLWYHKGVAFFDREVELYCEKVERTAYDVILFQDIPDVNNFYPYEVQECIEANYELKFKFLAPRIPEISYIYVYVRSSSTLEI
ncbi:hypothetical protein GCM10027429_32490 [Marivirga atlantica]|jgi:hypothetical protein|uniref:Glycosyltransferase family 39 protein n=1 Tax=Marivirga atlantica TaxID=1548457 RepID=A0A937AAW5_9BACT|nr:glycosyltransferase family 39 protein [Marivirga atlantica]MBL0766825.1 glycosyltransferase family 39 protein [Marivirga atlantica]